MNSPTQISCCFKQGITGGGQALGVFSSSIWHDIIHNISRWSGYVLATAMAGVGLGTSIRAFKGLGIKPFYVGLLAAIVVGATGLILLLLLKAKIDSDILRESKGVLQVDYSIGFWLAFLLFLFAAGLNGFLFSQRRYQA